MEMLDRVPKPTHIGSSASPSTQYLPRSEKQDKRKRALWMLVGVSAVQVWTSRVWMCVGLSAQNAGGGKGICHLFEIHHYLHFFLFSESWPSAERLVPEPGAGDDEDSGAMTRGGTGVGGTYEDVLDGTFLLVRRSLGVLSWFALW